MRGMADQKAVKSQTNTARVMALLHCSFVPGRKVEKQETGMSRDIKPTDRQDELQTLLLQCFKLLISAFTLNSESPFINSLVDQWHLTQLWQPWLHQSHSRTLHGSAPKISRGPRGCDKKLEASTCFQNVNLIELHDERVSNWNPKTSSKQRLVCA